MSRRDQVLRGLACTALDVATFMVVPPVVIWVAKAALVGLFPTWPERWFGWPATIAMWAVFGSFGYMADMRPGPWLYGKLVERHRRRVEAMGRPTYEPDPSLPYWTTTDVAAYCRTTVGTISSYRKRKQMPQPDMTVGTRTHLWKPETIMTWRPRELPEQ